MTPQKAIECIDEVLCATVHYDETLEYELTTDDTEWLETAKEALNKQTAEKPQVEIVSFDYGTTIEKCPCCGNPYITKDNNYCSKCGQRIDWGDAE